MAFNVINLKHREIQEGWLHLKGEPYQLLDSDGNKVFNTHKKEIKAYQYANLAVSKNSHDFELKYSEEEIDEIIHDGLTDTIVGFVLTREPVMTGDLAYADEEKTKPIRLKMKSIHSDAFRKAFFKMNVRLSRLKDSKQKDFELMSKSKQELSKDQLEAELIEVFMKGEEMAIDLICEMAIGWEGFVNQDGEALEFKPEYLKMFISDLNNYHVFQQVRDSLRDQSDFMEA